MNRDDIAPIAVLIGAAICASSALAQSASEARPDTCVLLATSQFDNCSVDNRYFCPAKGGAYFRIESFEADGLTFVAIEGEDYSFKTLVDQAGEGMTFDESTSTHPRDVLRTGTGKQAGSGFFSVMGMNQPMSMSVTMTSAGEKVEMAGRSFDVIEAQGQLKFPAPVGVVDVEIRFGYLPEDDVIIEFESNSYYGGGVLDESTLQAVSLANQPGFGNEQPAFGCGELSFTPFAPDLLMKG